MSIRQSITALILGIFLCTLGCATNSLDKVQLEETVDEGQASFRITTPAATWVFHKEGAGFASIVDRDGNDWANYHPEGGPAGHYRGIPNAVYHPDAAKDNYFHPGHDGARGSSTAVVVREADQVTLRSVSGNGRWEGTWEILPDRAIFSMTRMPTEGSAAYWVLYEGTPGGSFKDADLCLRSDGSLTPLSEEWEGSMEDITWVAFISRSAGRTLVLSAHQKADEPVCYWPMKDSMTVFGFGRALGPPTCHLTTPMSFTVAFLEETDPDRIAERVSELQGP